LVLQADAVEFMGGFMFEENKAVNLKAVAARVGLAPCSVSAILNDTEAARVIPQATKDRVYRAAAELNYRPNLLARSLRTKRTRMVAVVAPGLGRSSVAHVVEAAQRRLQESGYLLVLATAGDGDRMCAQFLQRGIEGVIAIEANVPAQLNLPVASVHLGSGAPDPVGPRLHELGDAAAETIIQQIENEGSSRRLRVETIAASYPALRHTHPGFSAAEGA
jgi:DNA-binding LacI/PurR family transcriptional regulator